MAKRPTSDEEKALFEVSVAKEGVTTLAGEATGLSLIDAGLIGAGANSFVSMMAVVYPGQPTLVDSKDISAFNNVTGEVTVASVFKGGQVAAGVPYKIVTFRFVPAEVAAIDAKLGAFTSTQNLKAILGDLSTTKRLGQILGGLDETDTLKAILGAYTAAANLKAAIDAIETKLDTPSNFMADVSALALEATLGTHDTDIKALLATIAGYIDAEVAAILALVDSAEAAGPYSYLDAGGEQTVKEDTAVTRRRIWLEFSNRNMTQAGTFIIYRKVDGTNYDIWDTIPVTVGAGDDRAWDAEFTTNQAWKLTYEEDADEGAARAIPYNVITQVIE